MTGMLARWLYSVDCGTCPAVRIGPKSVWAVNYECFCLQKSTERPSRVSHAAITQEQKRFSKIHESDCKPSTCLSCSFLNWHEKLSLLIVACVTERMNEQMKSIFVTLGSFIALY